jgi:hypothetical protein
VAVLSYWNANRGARARIDRRMEPLLLNAAACCSDKIQAIPSSSIISQENHDARSEMSSDSSGNADVGVDLMGRPKTQLSCSPRRSLRQKP